MKQSALSTAPTGPDAVAVNDIWAVWLRLAKTSLDSQRAPLSGNVSQMMQGWAQGFGQAGLFNVNLVNSSNPAMEGEIASRYSYGRQLGRILDVLAPLVRENGERLCEERQLARQDLDDFNEMVADIARTQNRMGPSLLELAGSVGTAGAGLPGPQRARLVEIAAELRVLGRQEAR
jgi:hypothetical protein